MAEQKPLPTGWIEGGQWVAWNGGPPPAPEEAVVFVLYDDGACWVWGMFVRALTWERSKPWHRHIVAYYLVTEDVGTLTAAPHISSAPPVPAIGSSTAKVDAPAEVRWEFRTLLTGGACGPWQSCRESDAREALKTRKDIEVARVVTTRHFITDGVIASDEPGNNPVTGEKK